MGCDTCECWYHPECVALGDAPTGVWSCVNCRTKDETGVVPMDKMRAIKVDGRHYWQWQARDGQWGRHWHIVKGAWVTANFKSPPLRKLLTKLKDEADRNVERGGHTFPVGSALVPSSSESRSGSHHILQGDLGLSMGAIVPTGDSRPVIEYPQGTDYFCAPNSMASALHYIGFVDEARQLVGYAQSILDDAPKSQAAEVMNRVKRDIKGFTVQRLPAYDPEADISTNPTMLQLCDASQCNTHAVTIVGRWVFDTRFDRALELSKKTLDYCCNGVPYLRASYAARAIPGKAVLKKLKKRKREDESCLV